MAEICHQHGKGGCPCLRAGELERWAKSTALFFRGKSSFCKHKYPRENCTYCNFADEAKELSLLDGSKGEKRD